MKRRLTLVIIASLLVLSNTYAAVTLIMPNMNGLSGTQVTVPVKVKDFISIISTQGTIRWDSTIVTFASVQQFGLPGMQVTDFNTAMAAVSGKLPFSWSDGTLAGVTRADSSVIFSITFNIIGTNGQTSAVYFGNSPTPIEIVNSSFATETTVLVNGSVHVTGTVGVNAADHNRFELNQNYPNPFAGSTHIEFTLPVASAAMISVFDMAGSKVAEISGTFPAGKNSVIWNAENMDGSHVRAGVYYLRLQSGNYSAVNKMIVW
jgi:hypothetical protein